MITAGSSGHAGDRTFVPYEHSMIALHLSLAFTCIDGYVPGAHDAVVGTGGDDAAGSRGWIRGGQQAHRGHRRRRRVWMAQRDWSCNHNKRCQSV